MKKRVENRETTRAPVLLARRRQRGPTEPRLTTDFKNGLGNGLFTVVVINIQYAFFADTTAMWLPHTDALALLRSSTALRNRF